MGFCERRADWGWMIAPSALTSVEFRTELRLLAPDTQMWWNIHVYMGVSPQTAQVIQPSMLVSVTEIYQFDGNLERTLQGTNSGLNCPGRG